MKEKKQTIDVLVEVNDDETLLCFFSKDNYKVGDVALIEFNGKNRFYRVYNIGDTASETRPYFVVEL